MIFEAINSLGINITSTKPYLVETNDKYARPPYLRFKFVSYPKENEVSTYLIRRVNEFSGNVKWVILSSDKSSNYILLPKIFEKYFTNSRDFVKEEILKSFGQDYYKTIDSALDDVPLLAEFIKNGIR